MLLLKKIKQRLKMLSDENIKKILNINTNDEKFYICHICLDGLKKYIDKKIITSEEIKEIIILNSIFEKNIEKILNKEVKEFLKEELKKYLNVNELKKEKNIFKVEKEEIQTYLKNIYEDIKRIQEQKELRIQEQKKLKKQKNINEDVEKILGNDKLSF